MAERKNSEKRIATNNRWTNAHYDRINIAVPKGEKEIIQGYAAAQGESVNGFIVRAVREHMGRNGAESPQEATEAAQRVGVVSLPSDTLESAQQAAERTGEAVPVFIARAVETQAQRDENSLKLGINPATGDKLKGEA